MPPTAWPVFKRSSVAAFERSVTLETELPAIPGLTPEGLPPTPREGLSLFTALEEQLGLKLESERGPVDVLVVDRVKQPTPD